VLVGCEVKTNGACALLVSAVDKDTQMVTADLVVVKVTEVDQRRIRYNCTQQLTPFSALAIIIPAL